MAKSPEFFKASFSVDDIFTVTVESKYPSIGKALIQTIEQMMTDSPEKVEIIRFMASMDKMASAVIEGNMSGADAAKKVTKKSKKKTE